MCVELSAPVARRPTRRMNSVSWWDDRRKRGLWSHRRARWRASGTCPVVSQCCLWTNSESDSQISGGSKGGARDVRPPGQILSISCSFWENMAKSYVGAPPLGSWRPLLGEILDPPLQMTKQNYLNSIQIRGGPGIFSNFTEHFLKTFGSQGREVADVHRVSLRSTYASYKWPLLHCTNETNSKSLENRKSYGRTLFLMRGMRINCFHA